MFSNLAKLLLVPRSSDSKIGKRNDRIESGLGNHPWILILTGIELHRKSWLYHTLIKHLNKFQSNVYLAHILTLFPPHPQPSQFHEV